MTILHTPGKLRINKTWTQFAVDALVEHLEGTAKRHWQHPRSDTSAYVNADGSFVVSLNDHPLLELKENQGSFEEVCVYLGPKTDSDGNPTNIARERLNGLFNILGLKGVIPGDVRVCYDNKVHFRSYIVCNDQRTVFGRGYCEQLSIKADPNHFVVAQARED